MKIGKNWTRFEGMTWLLPTDDIRWRLRYEPERVAKDELLGVASVLDAYVALIQQTQKKRNYICSKLQAVLSIRDKNDE